MSIDTILLHAASETCDPGRGAARYALGLARSFHAHLEALVLDLDVVTPDSLRARRAAADARAPRGDGEVRTAADELRQAAGGLGVDATVITERSHAHSAPEIAADRARLADIAVAGVRGEGLLSERIVAEALIFQSGRPVIVVPGDHRADFRAERVMVAWDFSKFAARALFDAMPFLRRASEVTLVSFGGDKEFASSTTPDDVLGALRRHAVSATYRQTERGGRDIGEAIGAATADLGADLLVMGGFGHSRFRDFILGGATRSILAAPRVPSLISH